MEDINQEDTTVFVTIEEWHLNSHGVIVLGGGSCGESLLSTGLGFTVMPNGDIAVGGGPSACGASLLPPPGWEDEADEPIRIDTK